jgi:hypothetical protein
LFVLLHKAAPSFFRGRCGVLEPCEAKVSRTVLRGLGSGDAARLLGKLYRLVGSVSPAASTKALY